MGVERERIGNGQSEGMVVQETAYVRFKGNI